MNNRLQVAIATSPRVMHNSSSNSLSSHELAIGGHQLNSVLTHSIVVIISHMTELATLAKIWLPPSSIHRIYPAENTIVQVALNRNMTNLMTPSIHS